MLMFGKDKKSDAQKALEERGKGFTRSNETIWYKDDYFAVVTTAVDVDDDETTPSWIACSDLTKEGYTLVIDRGLLYFQKLPK